MERKFGHEREMNDADAKRRLLESGSIKEKDAKPRLRKRNIKKGTDGAWIVEDEVSDD
jgi:hypothetical protein